MDTLFCPECHNILDLPTEDNIVTCDACQSVQNASGINYKYRDSNQLSNSI